MSVDALLLTDLDVFFIYGDDGHLTGKDVDTLEQGLNIIAELFWQLGLNMNMNSNKMKTMIFFGSIGLCFWKIFCHYSSENLVWITMIIE